MSKCVLGHSIYIMAIECCRDESWLQIFSWKLDLIIDMNTKVDQHVRRIKNNTWDFLVPRRELSMTTSNDKS